MPKGRSGGIAAGPEKDGMRDDVRAEKPAEEVQHWTAPPFIAPEVGEGPPVGGWVAKDAVCRDCMTAAEEIGMRRGFVDPISAEEAKEKAYVCTRCSRKIPTGS